MNKTILFICILASCLLVGCGKNSEEKKTLKTKATEILDEIEQDSIEAEKQRKQTPKDLYNYDVYIWTDEETGVQYIIYSHKNGYGGMGGITPRLNNDGSIYVVSK